MLSLSQRAAHAQLNALASLIDGGYLRIYGGARPLSPDVVVGSQRILAELRFGRPAFFAAQDGVLFARDIEPDESARLSDEATWYRVYAADGQTALVDGRIGTDNADLLVNRTTVEKAALVIVEEFRLKFPSVLGG